MKLNIFSVGLLVFAAIALIATAAYPERETWIAAGVFAAGAVLVEALVRFVAWRRRPRQ